MSLTRVTVGILVLAAAGWGAVSWMNRDSGRTLVEIGAVQRQASFRSTVSASGEVVATRYADIGSDVMGKVVALPVAEGDRVTQGQVLAQIDAVQARADVSGADALVAALDADARAAEEQVTAAGHDVAVAEARARDTQQVLLRRRQLSSQALIAAADLESAEAAAQAAAAQVLSARAAAERARAVLTAASRRATQARAQQVRAADILRKTSIVSPINGIVSRLRVRQGEMVVVGIQNQPGTTLMTISDLSEVNAEVKVAEAEVLRLRTGQAAAVTLEAIPEQTFTGRVIEIGASALPVVGTTAAAREFRVVIRLDAGDARLRPGLTCDAEIVTSEIGNALTLPLQSVVLRPGPDGAETTGVFLARDGVAQFVPVTTGVIGGIDIEVKGLEAGAPVIVGPFQALRDLATGTPVRTASTSR